MMQKTVGELENEIKEQKKNMKKIRDGEEMLKDNNNKTIRDFLLKIVKYNNQKNYINNHMKDLKKTWMI